MRRSTLLPTLALLAVGGLAPHLSGQEVRGRVTDADTENPVVSGIVKGIGTGGEVSALTGSSGGFVLSVPSGFGLETLAVERIGYESRTFQVSALGDLQDLHLRVDSAPIQLGGIVTTGESLCRGQGGGTAVAAFWEEARKSLEVTALTQRNRLVRFETETYERDLSPSDYSVIRGTASRRSVTAASPYRSISVAEMTEQGWVIGSAGSGWELFAPDAAVLLSDEFADQHCFRAEVARDSAFLHFTPNRDRDSYPELEGTLVLDSRTSELEELRFTYVGVPEFRRGGHAAGEIRFLAAPNGLRVVREWAVRAPVLSQVRQGLSSVAIQRIRVDRVREHGGRVLTMHAGGDVVELDLEPLDLGEPNSFQDPADLGNGTLASSRQTQGGNVAQLVVENDGETPFRVTQIQLVECRNTSIRCGDHPVDVTVPPGESRVVLSIGKDQVLDPFRFEWHYTGESIEPTEQSAEVPEQSGDVEEEVSLLAGRTEVEFPERASTDRFLNGADIPGGRHEDALHVVEAMRPRWLTVRPMQSPSLAAAEVRVYVDGILMTPRPDSSPEDALRMFPVSAIESIEYVDSRTATTRWGTNHQRGAILITTFDR